MTSNREEDQRVMEILVAARRKPATEREAYLQSACAGDEDLRREVADARRIRTLFTRNFGRGFGLLPRWAMGHVHFLP